MLSETGKIRFRIPLHKRQKEIFKDNTRFKILACGRRFGKTTLAAYDALYKVLNKEIYDYDLNVWIVAPTYNHSMIVWRKLLELAPFETIIKVNRSDRYIEFFDGSIVWCKSADNPDSLRGEGLDFLIVDEAAMVKKEAWEHALRPALADKQGSAIFISTPKGKNWFYELFLRGLDPNQPEYKSWQYPSWENPFLPKQEIEEMRKNLPELVFRQEVMAEFIEGGGVVFRNIHDCISGSIEEPQPNKSYVMGVDLAKYEDYTVIVVMDVSRMQVVYFDRFNQIDWSYQKSKIIEIAKKYNNAMVIIDSTGVGDPIYEDLQRAGLRIEGFKFTNQTKTQLIQNLALKIEQKQITFPQIEDLILELQAFGYEVTSTGNIRYGAPAGFHDDCVIALALAVWGAEKFGGKRPLFGYCV